ncbi:SixA phosphatase family protein [Thalassotalea euphylliae]|uniref:SixA phosphatase family protein n=1 Tax=Thalassotalea euphylliae TaxID=1655234 RepID=UPI0036435E08
MPDTRTIHFIRHAKSSWDFPTLADIDRPLNKRGLKTAPAMAEHIINYCPLTHVYCSPAARAQATIELIAKALPQKCIEWKTDETLYTFSSATLISWCQQIDTALNEVIIVGHNPAITDAVNLLSGANIDNVPTCGYVKMSTSKEIDWHSIAKGDFEIDCFLTPKKVLQR